MSEAKQETLIKRGDVYWVKLETEHGLEGEVRHPYVVVQEDVLNHSRITTVVVCALTSNRKRADIQGNVLLEVGEGGLPKQSVVEVGKVSTVEKGLLKEYIGSLAEERVEQILDGMRFLQRAFFWR